MSLQAPLPAATFVYKSDPVRGRQWAEVFRAQAPEIDFRICMYCGLCTEACPYEAIQPGGPLDVHRTTGRQCMCSSD